VGHVYYEVGYAKKLLDCVRRASARPRSVTGKASCSLDWRISIQMWRTGISIVICVLQTIHARFDSCLHCKQSLPLLANYPRPHAVDDRTSSDQLAKIRKEESMPNPRHYPFSQAHWRRSQNAFVRCRGRDVKWPLPKTNLDCYHHTNLPGTVNMSLSEVQLISTTFRELTPLTSPGNWVTLLWHVSVHSVLNLIC
jgi:hypothetical protein